MIMNYRNNDFDKDLDKSFMDDIADFAFSKSAEISDEIYEYNVLDNFSTGTEVTEDKYFKEVYNSFELLPVQRALTLKYYLTYLINSNRFKLTDAQLSKAIRNRKVLSGIMNGIKGRSYTFVEVNNLLCLKFNTSYGYTKEFDLGRLYPSKYSISHLSREYRWFLFKGIYVDIDIINAHPSMLLNFAKQQYLKTPHLETLVHTRDEFYETVQQEYESINTNFDMVSKTLVLASINSGRTDYKSETLRGLSIEIKNIRDELYKTKFENNGFYYNAVVTRCKDISSPSEDLLKQKTQTLYCFCEETRNILSLRNIILDHLDPSEVSIVPFFDGIYVNFDEFRGLSSSHQSIYIRTSDLVDKFNETSSEFINMKIKPITDEYKTLPKDEFEKVISCLHTFMSLNSEGIKRVLDESSIDTDLTTIVNNILNATDETELTFTVEQINELKHKYQKCFVHVLDYIYENEEYVKTYTSE